MIDVISATPGFEKLQNWFVQAIPALNKYMRLDAALSVNVRFKVPAPTNSLSVENRGNALFYLGFKLGTTTTPRLNGYESSTGIGYWARVNVQQTFVLFSPASFRAPCLHGFDNFSVGDAPFGSKYNPESALAVKPGKYCYLCKKFNSASTPSNGEGSETPTTTCWAA